MGSSSKVDLDDEWPYTHCTVCKEKLPQNRIYVGYHTECAGRAPKENYVIAGFGSKGNGAHITKFTHGEK